MLDFPSSPSVGQRFTSGGVIWAWDGAKWAATTSGGAISMVIGDTPPSAPKAGDLWFDSVGSQLYVWYVDPNTSQWVVVVNQGGSYFPINAPQVIGDNRVINGDMRIDQRNNGAASPDSVIYTVDRWGYYASQVSKVQRTRGVINSATFGFQYYMNLTSLSAYASLSTDIFEFYQPIEADMVSDFAWGTVNAQSVTLSFWAFSTLTGTFSGALFNYAGTRSYPFTFNIPAASTWYKFAITIPGDTAGTWVMSGNGGSFYVEFDLGCGANYRTTANAWTAGQYFGVTGTVRLVGTNGAVMGITGVKLEIGSIATPYPRQSLAKSLADCQRYYQTGWLLYAGYQSAAGATFQTIVNLPVAMRAAPTVAALATTNTNVSNFTLTANQQTNATQIYGSGNPTAVGNTTINSTFSASAEL